MQHFVTWTGVKEKPDWIHGALVHHHGTEDDEVGRLIPEVLAQIAQIHWTPTVFCCGTLGPSSKCRGLLMYLAVKGLGRSKHVTMQLPKECQQPDAAVCHG